MAARLIICQIKHNAAQCRFGFTVTFSTRFSSPNHNHSQDENVPFFSLFSLLFAFFFSEFGLLFIQLQEEFQGEFERRQKGKALLNLVVIGELHMHILKFVTPCAWLPKPFLFITIQLIGWLILYVIVLDFLL